MSLYGVSAYAHLIQFSVHVKNQDEFQIWMALHFIFRRFYSPDEISWRVKHIYIQSYVVHIINSYMQMAVCEWVYGWEHARCNNIINGSFGASIAQNQIDRMQM